MKHINNFKEFSINETGVPSGDYDVVFYDKVIDQLTKSGIRDCYYKEFDQYQGVYIVVPRIGKFWTVDFYIIGELTPEIKNKPYIKAVLTDDRGNEFSATRGDYFQLGSDSVLKNKILTLTTKTGKERIINSPRVKDLPDLLDVRTTIDYVPGTEVEHVILNPECEEDENFKIDVTKKGDRVDATSLIKYCRTKLSH